MLLGKTGIGKSTFLAQIILSDILASKEMAVFDPQDALIEGVLLDAIPEKRIADVLYPGRP
jgi:hypothetical protein